MNKKKWLLTVVIVVVLLIFGYWVFNKVVSNGRLSNYQTTSTSTPESTSIPAPFNLSLFLRGETSLSNGQKFSNTSTNDIVSFQLATGSQGINPSYDVLVNGKSTENITSGGEGVGQVGGFGISALTFSPNNQYFAFITRSDNGGGVYDDSINIIDIPRQQILSLFSPVSKEAMESSDRGQYQTIDTFISSYSWGNDNDIQVTMYAIGGDKTGFYQITPMETWDYDLTTGSSILVEKTS